MERLYGRADLLERSRLGLEQVCAGHGRLLLFTGEPGIGKSRLAEQVAAQAAERGAAVAWGRAWEAGGAPAYWPWIQVFRALDMDADPFFGAGAELGAAAAEARFVAFDRAVRSLEQAAARRPLGLVLDDLHAADSASLWLLLLLARDLRRSPILVIGAYRDAAAHQEPERATLLAKIAREAEVLPLSRLTAADVAAWAFEAHAELDPCGADALYRVTEGHPLFVVEALRWRARPLAARAWPVGPGVLDERLGDVSAGTRDILAAAAVFGREFSSAELAPLANAPADRVFEALREARAASIVVELHASDAFRFSHVLLRDRLYAELAPSRRAALHQRAGTLALERGAAPETLIHHLFEGQSAGEPLTIAKIALAAAEAELSRLAFEEAARIGRRALELDTLLPDRLAAELRLAVAEALIRLGDGPAGKALCLEAAALAEHSGADLLLARAALVYGTELASGTIDPTMVDLLRRALERGGSERSALRARLLARLAAALTPPLDEHSAPEIVSTMRSAIALARELGDAQTLLYVLQFGATVALLIPESERFAIMTETVELARSEGQTLALLGALPAYLTALLAHGERERAEAELPAYDALLLRFRQPLHRLRRLLVGSLLSALAGDAESSERACREAHEIARGAGPGPALVLWLTHRLSLAQLRGRPELVAQETPLLLGILETTRTAIPYSIWLLVGAGRRAEAEQRLRIAPLARLDIPSANLSELMGAAEASVLLGEREFAETLYPRLERASDRMLWNLGPGALLGPTARVLGDLARLIGRLPEAVRHYDAAIAFAEKLRSPPLIELCRERRALALQEAGASAARTSTPTDDGLAARAAPEDGRSKSEPPLAVPSPIHPELRREGELWVLVAAGGKIVRLRHGKGLAYLQQLLERPGRPVHVLELAGLEHAAGDAGAVLDPRAKAEYRQRLDDLGDALREAEAFGDPARAGRIQGEIDALAEQLAAAVGLGGRDRRAASDVERMRINVQRRLKDALERITSAEPAIGRYLTASIKTGTYCVYEPL